ncbi:hypothetical protein G4B88_001347 [Cannabis sativa]|uniref:Uncharacterized protein n=1 Tax=Cannabis sativa TaxID=3483 RepID=A0A7J6HZR5_CANSA|nr:hypothetical protein G4B88_001347 [Cannabis sativa]
MHSEIVTLSLVEICLTSNIIQFLHWTFTILVGLGKKELFQLAKNEVEFVFADNLVKRDLREMFNSAANKLDLLP